MDPFVGEVRAVALGYAPKGWALCDGSLIPIRSNQALFAIVGTRFGGDGTTTFALPDLRSRAIVNAGQGPGLSNYALGAKAGVETVTLDPTQTPAHVHGVTGQLAVSTAGGTVNQVANNFLANSQQNQYAEEAGTNTMAAGSITGTVSAVGGNMPHTNLQPYLAMNYIIALTGIFPQRS